MPLSVVIDEFHVVLLVRKGIREHEVRAVRRSLKRPGFVARLQTAIERWLVRSPSLRRLRIVVSR